MEPHILEETLWFLSLGSYLSSLEFRLLSAATE